MKIQVTPSPVQITHQPDPRRWLMLAVVLCAALIAVLDAFIVNVAIPSLERELHASFAQIQLIVAGYTLTYAVLLVTGGRLGDLYGRKCHTFLVEVLLSLITAPGKRSSPKRTHKMIFSWQIEKRPFLYLPNKLKENTP